MTTWSCQYFLLSNCAIFVHSLTLCAIVSSFFPQIRHFVEIFPLCMYFQMLLLHLQLQLSNFLSLTTDLLSATNPTFSSHPLRLLLYQTDFFWSFMIFLGSIFVVFPFSRFQNLFPLYRFITSLDHVQCVVSNYIYIYTDSLPL